MIVLKLSVDGNALIVVDLLPAHSQFNHPSTTLDMESVHYISSEPMPFHTFEWNIESCA